MCVLGSNVGRYILFFKDALGFLLYHTPIGLEYVDYEIYGKTFLSFHRFTLVLNLI